MKQQRTRTPGTQDPGTQIGRATRRRARARGQGGFTLVEMLVVITIIGLIMSLVGPRVLNYLSESKVKAAKIQIQSFSSALDLFYLDAGRYPSTAEGLDRAGQADRRADGWNGPYLKGGSGAERSLGQGLSLPIAGRAQRL